MSYKDPERAKEVRQASKKLKYQENPEFRAKSLEDSKQWRKRNPDKVHKQYRKRQLGFAGWTPERYNEFFVKQQGSCAICGAKPEGNLCADHAHTDPPQPRKLLCHNCNAGLGQFKDSPRLLQIAMEYLQSFMPLPAPPKDEDQMGNWPVR